MHFEDQGELLALVWELDAQESHSFLNGLANGIWMSGLLAVLVYWLWRFA